MSYIKNYHHDELIKQEVTGMEYFGDEDEIQQEQDERNEAYKQEHSEDWKYED